MKEAPEFHPKDSAEWRKWLHANHQKEDAVWVIFYKSGTANFNMSWSDSVDEALCYGWIDSTKKPIDKERFKQYFTKRKPKSNWSKVNKDKVEVLIQNGLMQKAGMKCIEVAKENGSWTYLDDVENLIAPKDFTSVLQQNKGAQKFYESLSKSAKKSILYRLNSAKRQETRDKRIAEIMEKLVAGERPV